VSQPLAGRVVAVCVSAATEGSLEAAMLEDVVDLIDGMEQVSGALLAPGAAVETAQRVSWPGMPVLAVVDTTTLDIDAALTALHVVGAAEAAVVCADAPDLPPLLLGKLFSALTTAEAAVCPASDGSLVAVAARLPVPGWLANLPLTLDDTDALDRLRSAAPPRALHVGSGWHRVGSVADALRLDPGLEGWEATRAWLSRPGS
jgi:glycosyltransferase A (GT-A) superfamily protein (DUF2064 family)